MRGCKPCHEAIGRGEICCLEHGAEYTMSMGASKMQALMKLNMNKHSPWIAKQPMGGPVFVSSNEADGSPEGEDAEGGEDDSVKKKKKRRKNKKRKKKGAAK